MAEARRKEAVEQIRKIILSYQKKVENALLYKDYLCEKENIWFVITITMPIIVKH